MDNNKMWEEARKEWERTQRITDIALISMIIIMILLVINLMTLL